MSSSQQEETEFGGPAVSKQRRVIHFSSGETLEEEHSDEEETDSHPFSEPIERNRLSFKNVAILIGRISLLTCDFLGERLAGALGLNAAKYQYAIDKYQRDHKTTSSQDAQNTKMIHLSSALDRSYYGATGDIKCPVDSHETCDEMNRNKGSYNIGYQTDDLE